MKNEINKAKKGLNLLPNYFKKIELGLFILLILIIVLTISKTLPLEKETARYIVLNGLSFVLLLFSLTKDKHENESTIKLRLQSFASAFIFGSVMGIVSPLINSLFDGNFSLPETSSSQLVLSMILFQNFMFLLAKRKQIKTEN